MDASRLLRGALVLAGAWALVQAMPAVNCGVALLANGIRVALGMGSAL